MKARLKVQKINTIVAENSMEMFLVVAKGVYEEKKDEWHIEALEEDVQRSSRP